MSTFDSKKRSAQDPLNSTPKKKKSKDKDNNAAISPFGLENTVNALSKKTFRVTGSVDPVPFIISRLPEINAMQSLIKETSFSIKTEGLPAQLRAQRRRAASHILTGSCAKSREKIATKRGRPFIKGKKQLRTNVQLAPMVYAKEYLCKQSNKRWLETHMWHVKRMKMVNIWGYRLASSPEMKSSRILYRAFTHSAVIHDASYEGCIELSGTTEHIVRVLNTVTDPLLPSVGSARYNKGQRMGKSYLYKYMQYPANLVCPIDYLWKPSKEEGKERTIWIWIHPSAYKEALSILRDTIKQEIQESTETIQICEQKEKLVRFDLAGPHSTALLQSVFRPIEEAPIQIERENSTEQIELWNDIGSLKSACSLSPDVVIGLTVQDPRLKFPQRKRPQAHSVPLEVESRLSALIRQWPTDVAHSKIWEAEARTASLDSKTSEYSLNKRREQNLIPGSKLDFTEKDSKIPVLLVYRGCSVVNDSTVQTSTSVSNEIESWSIILPGGWGMPFWNSLLFTGAKPIGLDNVRSLNLEIGQCTFPYDYPSTRAFAAQSTQTEETLLQKWSSKPPSKRNNYKRNGISYPFAAHFDTLFMKSDSTEDTSYSLLQGAKMISSLLANTTEEERRTALEKIVVESLYKRTLTLQHPIDLGSFLVKVRVKYIEKKVPFPNALVYAIEDPDNYMHHTSYIRHRTPAHQSKKDIKLTLKDEIMAETLLDENHSILPSSHQIGYITNGAFSFMHGCGVGLGACTASGIQRVIELDKSQKRGIKMLVLITNVDAIDYRPAQLQLLY
ncbi:ribonucleases P/MRP protein subunit POP1-domain-containing protein [Phycomyces nitens]|nr:ribonucleases P/MRP protein subunit POP1-domain-containing protein [Phycomyces nitens]